MAPSLRALLLCSLAPTPARAGLWPFGRRTSALAQKVRSLERDTLEFESGERILLEQLRQMRLATGELRSTLRESIAESERVAVANKAKVAKLEAEVGALKTKLAAAEQRASAADASAASAMKAQSSLDAAEAARLKKELAKTRAELKAATAPRPAPKAAAKKTKVSDGPSAARKTAPAAAAAPARRGTPQR